MGYALSHKLSEGAPKGFMPKFPRRVQCLGRQQSANEGGAALTIEQDCGASWAPRRSCRVNPDDRRANLRG